MSDTTPRRHLGLKDELMLALMPTVTVLLVMALVEALSNQRLLFASLASSAFLIYLDPEHQTNSVRTLLVAQLGAAVLGVLSLTLLGSGYAAAGTAMVLAILVMVSLNAMHPPAVSTALSFGLKAGEEGTLLLFALSVGVIVVLVVLQRAVLWLLRRAHRRRTGSTDV